MKRLWKGNSIQLWKWMSIKGKMCTIVSFVLVYYVEIRDGYAKRNTDVSWIKWNWSAYMYSKIRKDGVSNEWIKNQCWLNTKVSEQYKRKMLRWFGHIERRNEDQIMKQI